MSSTDKRRKKQPKETPQFSVRDVMRLQMPVFDEILAEQSVPLAVRPYRATDMLLKHCIRPVGDREIPSVGDMMYGSFYYPVLAWYRQTYGRDFSGAQPLDEDLVGIAVVRGSLVELRIPTAVHLDGKDDEHVDIQFPLSLRGDEDPLAFLHPRPRLSSIRGVARTKLVAQVTATTNTLRKIYNLMLGLDGSSSNFTELRTAFLESLKSTAVRAASGRSMALALFDLRMTCEIALKIHLLQRNGKFDRTHDFAHLLGGAADEVRKLFDRQMPKELESYSSHNARRYGAKLKISTTEFFDIYKSALYFLHDLIRTLKRKIVLNNAVFIMKRLPWMQAGPTAFGYRFF